MFECPDASAIEEGAGLNCFEGELVYSLGKYVEKNESDGKDILKDCNPGYFCDGNLTQLPCEPMTFTASSGSFECNSCLLGTYSPNASATCDSCPDGSRLAVDGTSADDCEPVPSGSNVLLYALLGAGFFTLGIGGVGFIMHQRRKPLNNANVLSAHLLKGEPTGLAYGNEIEFSDYIPSELMIASNLLTIGHVLGGGATGVVKAGKIGNSQSVAIKLVHRRLVSTDGAAWWRECEILTRVRHPNCVAFYGFSYDDTFFMFIQELCSGGNLKGACSTSPETVEGRAIEFMLQIASGVEYLHNANIIHRDIKVNHLPLSFLRTNLHVLTCIISLPRCDIIIKTARKRASVESGSQNCHTQNCRFWAIQGAVQRHG